MTYIPHALLTVLTIFYSSTLQYSHRNQHTHCMKQYRMVSIAHHLSNNYNLRLQLA